jgi:hypothetical protein
MKRCKLCKELKVREVNGIAISKFCSSCKKVKELEKKAKHKLTKTCQKKEFKKLHRKAWKKISEYVRKQEANEFGMTPCYTCGGRFHYAALHCGHYLHNKLDFDLRNLKPQCPQCNLYLSGNLAVYGLRLAKENSVEWLEQLHLDANTTTYTIEDLERIIEQYK